MLLMISLIASMMRGNILKILHILFLRLFEKDSNNNLGILESIRIRDEKELFRVVQWNTTESDVIQYAKEKFRLTICSFF